VLVFLGVFEPVAKPSDAIHIVKIGQFFVQEIVCISEDFWNSFIVKNNKPYNLFESLSLKIGLNVDVIIATLANPCF